MKKKIFLLIVGLLFLLILSNITRHVIDKENMNKDRENILKKLDSLNIDSDKKLMIVAHPDDDIIWGGSHLIEDDYLVVCITCGTDQTRVEEFKKVMTATNDDYIMLDYPDRTNGKRDNWNSVYDLITNSLDTIINYKDWNTVVTHNPDGEYGHIQHKMTSKIVTSLANKDNLMYFGHYYEPGKIPENLETIPTDNYDIKINTLVPLYASQKIVGPYGHMLNHEVWISYNKWSDNND
jgi:LmbE family N-acetylglucosaminyl deacetylase